MSDAKHKAKSLPFDHRRRPSFFNLLSISDLNRNTCAPQPQRRPENTFRISHIVKRQSSICEHSVKACAMAFNSGGSGGKTKYLSYVALFLSRLPTAMEADYHSDSRYSHGDDQAHGTQAIPTAPQYNLHTAPWIPPNQPNYRQPAHNVPTPVGYYDEQYTYGGGSAQADHFLPQYSQPTQQAQCHFPATTQAPYQTDLGYSSPLSIPFPVPYSQSVPPFVHYTSRCSPQFAITNRANSGQIVPNQTSTPTFQGVSPPTEPQSHRLQQNQALGQMTLDQNSDRSFTSPPTEPRSHRLQQNQNSTRSFADVSPPTEPRSHRLQQTQAVGRQGWTTETAHSIQDSRDIRQRQQVTPTGTDITSVRAIPSSVCEHNDGQGSVPRGPKLGNMGRDMVGQNMSGTTGYWATR